MLAVLYFGLIQLLMMDASQQLADARRFRARIVALTHAENGAELAAANLVGPKATHQDDAEDLLGNAWGRMMKGEQTGSVTAFTIEGRGEATGVAKMKAVVKVYGEIVQNGPSWTVRINSTDHTQ